MYRIRKSHERGRARLDWLASWHSFSFADYYDPEHMGFGPLRVINDDIIAPGGGFPTHPHRDMEIITYVLDGALEHKDSMGNGSVIEAGDVQYMSAGTGVAHSEFNASDSEPVHLHQIWILPDRQGHTPRYGQKHFDRASKDGRLRLVASGDGRDESIGIRRDVDMYALCLEQGQQVEHRLAGDRMAWAQVARGRVTIDGHELEEGDALAIEPEAGEDAVLSFENGREAEIILFDAARPAARH